jgi:probable rRNA maturation factor
MVNIRLERKVKLSTGKATLLKAAQLTLDEGNAPEGSEMSIVIGDDDLLRELNQKYRSVDRSTDVLSFLSNEPDPDSQSIYLGDVVISLPHAEFQASSGGHPVLDELQLLVVHGTLHLLGYDHLRQSDKKKMQAAQDKILTELGVKLLNIL